MVGEGQGHDGLAAAVVQGLGGLLVGGASGDQLGGVKFSLLWLSARRHHF